ncbi:hypothetical protein M407DRAFT_243940 [Tulasnella calospora MUT 4182]|uniref:Uncharacterized protein n=1 Tax=Tulasnella calospora MUT 4182 TaxID=1051891 RepID=A0A0C3QH97_9AGAM|nr:hypothetical protein M407DRAFT_243940 [Tulasnella calospora MUT 4182]
MAGGDRNFENCRSKPALLPLQSHKPGKRRSHFTAVFGMVYSHLRSSAMDTRSLYSFSLQLVMVAADIMPPRHVVAPSPRYPSPVSGDLPAPDPLSYCDIKRERDPATRVRYSSHLGYFSIPQGWKRHISQVHAVTFLGAVGTTPRMLLLLRQVLIVPGSNVPAPRGPLPADTLGSSPAKSKWPLEKILQLRDNFLAAS